MKRHALAQSEVPLFLNGASELRVVVKPQPVAFGDSDFGTFEWRWTVRDTTYHPWDDQSCSDLLMTFCPYPVGSELALTETWMLDGCDDSLDMVRRSLISRRVIYKAESPEYGKFYKWRSPATMPAEFSRFPRRVTAMRVERLQDVTYDGIVASGWSDPFCWRPPLTDVEERAKLKVAYDWFEGTWNAAHPDYPWESNPWTWVLTLEEVK